MFSHSYIFGRSYNSFKNFLKIDTYESFPILSILLTDKTTFRELFNKTSFNNDKE